jgi:hypothetical protein
MKMKLDVLMAQQSQETTRLQMDFVEKENHLKQTETKIADLEATLELATVRFYILIFFSTFLIGSITRIGKRIRNVENRTLSRKIHSNKTRKKN